MGLQSGPDKEGSSKLTFHEWGMKRSHRPWAWTKATRRQRGAVGFAQVGAAVKEWGGNWFRKTSILFL